MILGTVSVPSPRESPLVCGHQNKIGTSTRTWLPCGRCPTPSSPPNATSACAWRRPGSRACCCSCAWSCCMSAAAFGLTDDGPAVVVVGRVPGRHAGGRDRDPQRAQQAVRRPGDDDPADALLGAVRRLGLLVRGPGAHDGRADPGRHPDVRHVRAEQPPDPVGRRLRAGDVRRRDGADRRNATPTATRWAAR